MDENLKGGGALAKILETKILIYLFNHVNHIEEMSFIGKLNLYVDS